MTDDEAWQGYRAQRAFDEAYKRYFEIKAEIEAEVNRQSHMTGQQVVREEWDKKAAKRKTELRRPWLTGWRA